MKIILVYKRKVQFEPTKNHSTNMKIHVKINIAKINIAKVISLTRGDCSSYSGYVVSNRVF